MRRTARATHLLPVLGRAFLLPPSLLNDLCAKRKETTVERKGHKCASEQSYGFNGGKRTFEFHAKSSGREGRPGFFSFFQHGKNNAKALISIKFSIKILVVTRAS